MLVGIAAAQKLDMVTRLCRDVSPLWLTMSLPKFHMRNPMGFARMGKPHEVRM